MLAAFRQIFEGVVDRLHQQAATLLPPVLAGLVILSIAYALGLTLRWTITRIFKGLAIDKFLRQSGLAFVIDPSGRLRAARVAAELSYWLSLTFGALTALSIFHTEFTTRMVQDFVLLLPKLFLTGVILLAGIWLSQYLGRGVLVWASKEGFPRSRALADLVRVLVVFVAVVVAADQLNFARSVFLAAFIMIAGGLTLAASVAFGIGAGRSLSRFLEERDHLEAAARDRS